ncbi:hypothetical protein R5R51_08065 [Oenococcus oeni]|uniref:hypothetical protein n=2 Tax=Oenococcus oeni TaxID=1247 RepID=UPI000BDE6D8E|nr:hypothetical protein [Oenococcus oeni]PDH85302.1 hypothetical protein AO462_03550 [Oenococcus oeni]TEU20845.1 hypothetical protein E2146_04510 [Oenococcus oeni]TEU59062.1 hypothetical protein E2142_03090 [Oenococcus oeni]TEU59297.1 hypothetical protein E2144_08305 [Oenococcus oeni]
MDDKDLEKALLAIKDYAKKSLDKNGNIFVEDFSVDGIKEKEEFFKDKDNQEIFNIFQSLDRHGKLSFFKKNRVDVDMSNDILFPYHFRLNNY